MRHWIIILKGDVMKVLLFLLLIGASVGALEYEVVVTRQEGYVVPDSITVSGVTYPLFRPKIDTVYIDTIMCDSCPADRVAHISMADGVSSW